MTSTNEIRDTLLWAAGASTTPVLTEEVTADLLDAMRDHRLEARLLARAERDGVEVAPGLAARLREHTESTLRRVHTQIELFRSVRDTLLAQDPDSRLLPMKGFSLYALTGDPVHAPFSHDVDVIGRDPQAVAAAVEQTDGSGYHFHGEEHPYVYAHMDDLEVHMHYVVTGIDPRLEAHDVDVTTRTGVLEVGTPFSASLLTHADMVEHTAPGRGAAAGLEVLRPEMAVLIRCAHVYVGFAMNPQPLPWATVPLEELVQLRDYLALPMFDAERFRALHARHDAGLVTDFARELSLQLLGHDPFEPVLPGGPTRTWYPGNLWWDGSGAGFPAAVPWAADQLVACAQTHPDLVDVLGASEVMLPAAGTTATVTFLDPGAPDAAERYVHHAYHGGIAPVRLELSEIAGGVRAAARFGAVDDDQMVAIGWASGDHRYEVFFRPGDGTHDFADYSDAPVPDDVAPSVVACTADADATTITVDLTWPSLGRAGAPDGADGVPLLFRGRVQRRPWGEVAGGVVAPLRLRR